MARYAMRTTRCCGDSPLLNSRGRLHFIDVEVAQAATALNERGQELMKEEKYSAAAETFVKASQLVNGENELYPNNAGRAFYKAGNYKDSISWLGAALSLDPKAALTYLHRAEAFLALRAEARGRQVPTRKIIYVGSKWPFPRFGL